MSEEITADRPIKPPLTDNKQLPIASYQKVIYEIINSQKTRIMGTMQRQLSRNTPSTSTNNISSQRPSYLDRQREPTLTAAAVIESIKKKRAASMQNLSAENNPSKATRTDSGMSKLPGTRSSKHPPSFAQSKEMTSKSLGNLNTTGTESNSQVKVHRPQTYTKMPPSSTNSSKPREREPYNYWEEKATAKKPLAMNSNARNLPIYPVKQSSYEKKTILEPSGSTADLTKPRAVLRTAPRALDNPRLTRTRNDDFHSPYYVSNPNSTDESTSSLENIIEEEVKGQGQEGRGNHVNDHDPEPYNNHDDRDDGYRNSRSRESVSVADKRSILNEAKARTRAATSVPWLTSQMEIQKGQGDFGVRQRRYHEEQQSKCKLFSVFSCERKP